MTLEFKNKLFILLLFFYLFIRLALSLIIVLGQIRGVMKLNITLIHYGYILAYIRFILVLFDLFFIVIFYFIRKK
jgi:hypothetical protein